MRLQESRVWVMQEGRKGGFPGLFVIAERLVALQVCALTLMLPIRLVCVAL